MKPNEHRRYETRARALGLPYVDAFLAWARDTQGVRLVDAAGSIVDPRSAFAAYAGVNLAAMDLESGAMMEAYRTSVSSSAEPVLYRSRLVGHYICGALGLDPALAAAGPEGTEYLLARAHADRLGSMRMFRLRRPLCRIQWALDRVAALDPAVLLDVGVGDGNALMPLLDAFPRLGVIVVEPVRERHGVVAALQRGGCAQIRATFSRRIEEGLEIADDTADVATALEVLEHLDPDSGAPLRAARELLRVSCKAVLVSVPSVADRNPDHRQLFTAESLASLWYDAGASRVQVESVPAGHVAESGVDTKPPGHFVAVAWK